MHPQVAKSVFYHGSMEVNKIPVLPLYGKMVDTSVIRLLFDWNTTLTYTLQEMMMESPQL